MRPKKITGKLAEYPVTMQTLDGHRTFFIYVRMEDKDLLEEVFRRMGMPGLKSN